MLCSSRPRLRDVDGVEIGDDLRLRVGRAHDADAGERLRQQRRRSGDSDPSARARAREPAIDERQHAADRAASATTSERQRPGDVEERSRRRRARSSERCSVATQRRSRALTR